MDPVTAPAPLVPFSTVQDRARTIVAELLEETLKGQKYQVSQTQDWINQICAQAVNALKKLGAFKLTATCVIVQKTEGGVHAGSAACWEADRDGCLVERWESPEMMALCIVFACSL